MTPTIKLSNSTICKGPPMDLVRLLRRHARPYRGAMLAVVLL